MNTSKINQIKNILKLNNCRITKSRLAVATILIKNSDTLLSSDDIFYKIKSSKKFNCDHVSVYRILSTFEKLGLVKKNIFQGDAARYALNDLKGPQKYSHEHFFKCIQCNVIESFADCLVSKKEKELEKNGYKNLNHHLEITGLCPSCALI